MNAWSFIVCRTTRSLPPKDLCYHRGAPLSLGHVEGDEIICKYDSLRTRKAVARPAHPNGAIATRLRLHTFPIQEAHGLVWVRLVQDAQSSLRGMKEWDDPDYIQILPDSVQMSALAGRQVEGFLDAYLRILLTYLLARLVEFDFKANGADTAGLGHVTKRELGHGVI